LASTNVVLGFGFVRLAFAVRGALRFTTIVFGLTGAVVEVWLRLDADVCSRIEFPARLKA
jgi:hypothetical protein